MANYFNADYYFAAKAKQLSTTEKTWTAAEVQAEFAKQGINAEDHYKAYGASEGLSPNAYFNEKEYLASKLAALQDNDPTWANKTVADLQAEFKALGINAADHYEQYGAFETRKDGTLLNPSNAFDANAYFAAKLAQLQKIGFEGADTMTVADVVKAVQEAGISPVAHLQAYGATEAKTDGIPLVQTVPVAQRVANDPARVANGELVPGNYNQPTKGPAAAVAAPVTKPADVGGLSATAPKLPSEPVKTPADAGFVAPPASLVDGPNDTIIPPTGTTGTGPNNSFIVVDSTGKGTVVNKDGTIQGTIDKVETDSNGNFVQPPLDVVIKDANGNNTNDKPADNTGNPVEPTPPTVDPEPEAPVDPPAPAAKPIALTGEGWVSGTTAVEIKAYRTDATGAAAADGEYVTFIIGTDLDTNTKKSTAFKVADYDIFEFSQYQKVTVDTAVTAMTGLKPFTGKGVVFVAAAAGSGDQSITADMWSTNMATSLTTGTDGSSFSGGTHTSGDTITLKAKDQAVYDIEGSVTGFEKITIDGVSGSGSTYEVGALVDTADITFKGSAGNDTLVISGGITDFADLKAAQLTHGGGKDVLKVTAAASLDYDNATSGDYFGNLNEYAVSGNQGFHTLLLDNGTSALADLDLSKLNKYESIAFAGTGLNTLSNMATQSIIVADTNVNLKLGSFVSADTAKTVNLLFQNIDAQSPVADGGTLKGTVELDAALNAGILNVTGSALKDELILTAGVGDFAAMTIKANMDAGDDTVTLNLGTQASGSAVVLGKTGSGSYIDGGSDDDTVVLTGYQTSGSTAADSISFTNLMLKNIKTLDVSTIDTTSNKLNLILTGQEEGVNIVGNSGSVVNQLTITGTKDLLFGVTTGSSGDAVTYGLTESGAFGINADLGSGDDTLTLDLSTLLTHGKLDFVAESTINGGEAAGNDTLKLTGALTKAFEADFSNVTLTNIDNLDLSAVTENFGLTMTFSDATTLNVTGAASGGTIMNMGSGDDSITFSGAEALTIDTGKGADEVTISNGAKTDTIILNSADVFAADYDSFAGFDTITGFTAGSGGTKDILEVSSHVTKPASLTDITSAAATVVSDNAIYRVEATFADAQVEDAATAFTALFDDNASKYFKATQYSEQTKAVVVVQGTTDSFVFYIDSAADGDATDFTAEDIAYVAKVADISGSSTDFDIANFA